MSEVPGVAVSYEQGTPVVAGRCRRSEHPSANHPAPAAQKTDRVALLSDRRRVGWLNGFSSITSTGAGRGTARAEDAQGTPTQSHISPSILVYEE